MATKKAVKKHTVAFTATKEVKVAKTVKFATQDGPVKFKAKTPVKKKVAVKFKAKDK